MFAVSFDGIERVGGNRLAVSRVGGTFRRYLELAVFSLAEAVKSKYGCICFGVNAIRR